MIAIVDLGVGNFANVEKALGGTVTDDPEVIADSDKIVLPGVGNFGAVVDKMEHLREVLTHVVQEGKPFLGICLGMQLLFESSEEDKGAGLGVFQGRVVGFREVDPPHIGWNQLVLCGRNPLFTGIQSKSYFYFVHSFYVQPAEEAVVAARTEVRQQGKSEKFPSAVGKNNVFGTQFHPEKSGPRGKALLRNFKNLEL
ncbi:MAG: imidazole glycerol phosphate synthase subunit HisH [Candidatus Bipolaricaulota bacterium]